MEGFAGAVIGFIFGWVWGGTLCNPIWWQWLAEEEKENQK